MRKIAIFCVISLSLCFFQLCLLFPEVLGAILSIFGIWILTLGLLVLATNRIYNMNFDIDADAMMAVSGLGVFINIM